MGTEGTASPACTLCERPVTGTRFESTDGDRFCSEGCREVHESIDDGGDRDGDVSSGRDSSVQDHRPDDTSRAFFAVDGMHNGTCETFLETVALGQEGVSDAEASYVTETIRVDYDPDRISEERLRESLTTVGYTARSRDEDGSFGEGSTGGGGVDDLLGYRYVAGVVFASFLLFPYVLFLYPAYLASVFEVAVLDLFAGRVAFGSGSALLLLPMFVALTSVVVFFTGLPLLRGAYVSLKVRQPTTDLLVSVTVGGAFLYSVVSMATGGTVVYFDLTVVVAAVVVAATLYETSVKRTALDRLGEVTGGRIRSANRYEDDGTTTAVETDELTPGDRVLVRAGERIPVDGVVDEGECTVEEAVMTGEPLPVVKSAGDRVVGGSIVTDDAAVVAVDDDATSSIDRLATAVWGIQSADHGVQRRANRLAAVAIPAVVLGAAAVGVGSVLLGPTPVGATLAALATLVVATPWALGLATPFSVASSIRDALARGVVVFDETTFERLREVDTVVFDKTGTLTTGEMEVLAAEAPSELLSAVAALERRANHPAADAIVDAYGAGWESPGDDDAVGGEEVAEFENHRTGVSGTVGGAKVLVGNLDRFRSEGWSVGSEVERAVADARDQGHLPVVVGRDGQAEGHVVVGDRPREDWEPALGQLQEDGLETVVLTGDDGAGAGRFADSAVVDRVFAGVPPEGKAAAVERLRRNDTVAMVGDGTNDAPALAAADLGIVLDGGTALAADAADLAIVDDQLKTVGQSFETARAAGRRVRWNNRIALGYNVVAIGLALGGLLVPPLVVAAAAACALALWANSSRTLTG